MVPVPESELVLLDVLTPTPVVPAVVVVLVDVSWATAVLSATAQAAPPANKLINVLFFMCILCLFERMNSVVLSSDRSSPDFIQAYPQFVTCVPRGRIDGAHPRRRGLI
jgi:hypothetical protein